jgi:hypothetical protein
MQRHVRAKAQSSTPAITMCGHDLDLKKRIACVVPSTIKPQSQATTTQNAV